MSDFVYKQMINKVTNLPIQGGIFFLRNVETLEDYDFDELPDDGTGSTQGRYVTTTVVPNGVYKIYRVVASVDTDTGDEVHVEPGRVMHGGLDGDPFYPPVSRVVGDVVHVAGFIPDEETDTLSSYITDAMAWAVANNYSSIKVGGFKGSSTWTGATTIVVPAGIDHIDLDGATIACTGANIAPINNEATKLHISNGGIQGNGTGSTPHVTSAYGILYTSVTFIGFGGGSPVQGFTTTTGGGTPTQHTVYLACKNVRFDGGYRQRAPGVYASGTQAAFGSEYPVDTGTGAQAYERHNVLFSDVDAVELTQWIRASLNLPVAAPVDVARFASMTAVAEAVKHLWYTTKPYFEANSLLVDTVVHKGDLSAQMKRFAWSGDWDHPVSTMAGATNPTGVISGVQQGFVVKKYRKFASTKYTDICVDLVFSWGVDSGGMSSSILWRPYELYFSSTALKAALNDIDGSTSLIPSLWDSRRLLNISGIIAQSDGTGFDQRITARLSGGELRDETGESRFYVVFDNVSAAGNDQLKLREWLNDNSINSPGPIVVTLRLEWINPNNTDLPRIG